MSGADTVDRDQAASKMTLRLPAEARRVQILDQAAIFFAEHGFTAQTRAIADACGIAQRLLYHCFPSKSVLIEEVYQREILAPLKAVWVTTLEDRSMPMETRLSRFYADYFETVLTRRWLHVELGLTDDWRHMIDATTVRGHTQPAGAKRGPARRVLVETTAALRAGSTPA